MADIITPRPGGLVESHRSFDPRVILFYFVLAGLLLTLAIGLAYQQLIKSDYYHESAKVQNQRRILIPGPRGNIYDREGRLLVGNRARFAVTLYLDELRPEFRREYLRIRNNYREADDAGLPSAGQIEILARHSVVQRYLDQVNRIIDRTEKVDSRDLHRHYLQQRLLPFVLIEDLTPEEYARLYEQLPVTSPLQLYTSSTRYYPYGAAAAHTLGYVSINNAIEASEDFPGSDLRTFKMKGAIGRNGLEAEFDDRLQGETGGIIYRVDPSGYRVEPPLEKRTPVQGGSLTVTLDIDMQIAAEKAMGELGLAGACVALDVRTGEVLTLASLPAYDLNDFSPRLGQATAAQINEQGAWINRATQGLYPPGSTFKLITALAGLRAGTITPLSVVECTGAYRVGGRIFVCNNHRDRGDIDLLHAIEKSCNTFFYHYGLATGPDAIAIEARRFGLDDPTGIELPHEARAMIIPDPAWKKERRGEPWYAGDTANVSIGQGDIAVTPLQMATVIAGLARGRTNISPHILHDPSRPVQNPPRLDLPTSQLMPFYAGMQAVPITGTARIMNTPFMKIQGLTIAGKTGTAQKRTPKGTLNFAWFVGYAPVENPQVAVAVMMEGDTPGEDTGGGRFAAPIANAVLKVWHAKQAAPAVDSDAPAPSSGP